MTLTRRLVLGFVLLSLPLLSIPNFLVGLALNRHFAELARREAQELAQQIQQRVQDIASPPHGDEASTFQITDPSVLHNLSEFMSSYLLQKEGRQIESGFFLELNSLDGRRLLNSPNLESLQIPTVPLNTVQDRQMQAAGQSIPVMVYHRSLYWQDQKIAELNIAVSMLEYQYIQQRLFNFGLIGACLALLCSLGLAIFLSRQVLDPLAQLTQEVEDMIKTSEPGRLQIEHLPPDQIRRLASVFNSLLSQLGESLKQQQRFVSDASHELRSPLTAIQGHAELLIKRGQSNPEILKEGLEVIRQESDRLGKLVENLLLLARLQHHQPRKTVLDLNLLCREVVESGVCCTPISTLRRPLRPGFWGMKMPCAAF